MISVDVLDFDFEPERLPARDQELSTIDSALRRLGDGREGNPVRIYGPSGAGKTTVATFAAREAAIEYGADHAYVDCIKTRTRASVLHSVCSDLGMAAATADSTPPAKYHEFLVSEVGSAVVVLDEVAHLSDMTVIRELFQTRGVVPIVVTHDADRFGSQIDESLASRLRTGPRVSCQRYSVDEVIEILTARLRIGDLEHRVSDGALEFAAETAAGNARDALATLKEALESVDRGETVREADVEDVEGDAERRVIHRNLSRLDTEHRGLYELIRDAGEIRSGELASQFADLFDVSDRDRRRCLNVLEYYHAIESEGTGRGKTYRPRRVIDVDGPKKVI